MYLLCILKAHSVYYFFKITVGNDVTEYVQKADHKCYGYESARRPWIGLKVNR